METKTMTVPNITCGHCVMTIEREIGEMAGVLSVKGDRETKQVTISLDPEAIDWVAIEEAMREINYPPVA